MASLDRILEHRRSLERVLGRDPGVGVAAADLLGALQPGGLELAGALEREVARGRRTGRSFAVLCLEAPGLVSAEAEYGPLFGDMAQQKVREVVHDQVRECDAVVALGPAALAVVLPETTADGARALASRLEAAVGLAFAARFLGRETAPGVRLTWAEHPAERNA